MSTRKNIFGLNEVYKLQIEGSWTTKDEVWIQPTFTSVIDDRIGSVVGSANTIGISTVSIVIGQAVRSNVVSAGTTVTGIGTTDITISNPTTNASTDRFLFDFGTFNDTATYNYGTGASLVGYFVAGYDSSESTHIRRLDYSSDTITNVSDNIGEGRAASGQTVSSPTSGYYAGGKISTVSAPKSSISKLDFSSDTVSPVSATLGPAPGRSEGASLSNKNFGYFGGGQTVYSPEQYTSNIERIDFSNDTTSDTTADITSGAVRNLAATGNKNKGYFAGGQYTSPNQAYINKFDYSNDTTDTSTVSPGLSVARNSLAATGNDNFGYFAGGYNGSANVSTVDRIDYSSDTIVSSPSPNVPALPQTQSSGAATGNASSGYWAGGDIAGDPNNDDAFKFDFSSDTFSTISNALPNSVPNLSAFSAVRNFISDPNPLAPVPVPTIVRTFAYWTSGSYTKGNEVHRLNYSNDTFRVIVTGPDEFETTGSSATGNSFFAYIGGGRTSSNRNTSTTSVARINYSSDTSFLTASLDLLEERSIGAALGNVNLGYWTGGQNSSTGTYGSLSSIDKIDFSNDTADAVDVGNLSTDRKNQSAMSNQSFGYICGGSDSNTFASVKSTVDKLNFSNDTLSAGSNLILQYDGNDVGATLMGAMGNANYGYLCGGDSEYYSAQSPRYKFFSDIQRINYSNDTIEIITSKLNDELATGAATSNSSYGWMVSSCYTQGFTLFQYTTYVQRIDFSNDTVDSTIPNLEISKQEITAFNASSNGAT